MYQGAVSDASLVELVGSVFEASSASWETTISSVLVVVKPSTNKGFVSGHCHLRYIWKREEEELLGRSRTTFDLKEAIVVVDYHQP